MGITTKSAGKTAAGSDGPGREHGGKSSAPPPPTPLPLAGSKAQVTILCVDDDSLLLDFLSLQLELAPGLQALVLKATNAAAALALARHHELDVAIVDLCLPDIDGLSLAVELAGIQPHCRRLLLSGNLTENHANRLLYSNVHGCLLKSQAHSGELIRALHELREGRTYFPLAVLALLAGARREPGHFSKILSDRETELLPYFGYGWRHDQIARHVRISPATVRTHLQHILAKLGLHCREELMRWSIKKGFVDFRYEPAQRQTAGAEEKSAGSSGEAEE
jgi:DNA-binding NarL/FixJ family response regulator